MMGEGAKILGTMSFVCMDSPEDGSATEVGAGLVNNSPARLSNFDLNDPRPMVAGDSSCASPLPMDSVNLQHRQNPVPYESPPIVETIKGTYNQNKNLKTKELMVAENKKKRRKKDQL
jgi:hypothetical protein